jgi:hypothetical protein
MQLLLSDGMTYSIVACAAISMDYAQNTIPLLLFTSCCLVTAGCRNSTTGALNEYATISLTGDTVTCPLQLTQGAKTCPQLKLSLYNFVRFVAGLKTSSFTFK